MRDALAADWHPPFNLVRQGLRTAQRASRGRWQAGAAVVLAREVDGARDECCLRREAQQCHCQRRHRLSDGSVRRPSRWQQRRHRERVRPVDSVDCRSYGSMY
jgi:hypothetical protein